MGKDIVYLPMFYKNGTFIPAASAFLLKENGVIKKIECSKETVPIAVRSRSAHPFRKEIADCKRLLSGAYLIGYNDEKLVFGDTLCHMTDSLDVWYNEVILKKFNKYRYIQLLTPNDSVALCEMSFYEQGEEDNPIDIANIFVDVRVLNSTEKLEMMTDNLSATGCKVYFDRKKGQKSVIWFDLGKPRIISKISYVPYTKTYLPDDNNIELCYWDNRWVVSKKFKRDFDHIVFDNVPKGTIYWVKVKGKRDRIFTYNDGLVHWY